MAMRFDLFLRGLTVWNVNVFRIYIDMIKQMSLHIAVVALYGVMIDGVVFVKIKADHIFKTQTFFFVHADQFFVQSFWSGTGSKAKHTFFLFFLFLFYQDGYFFCSEERAFLEIFVNFYCNFF